MIISGGENIYPPELESAINKLGAVSEVAVIRDEDRLQSEKEQGLGACQALFLIFVLRVGMGFCRLHGLTHPQIAKKEINPNKWRIANAGTQ